MKIAPKTSISCSSVALVTAAIVLSSCKMPPKQAWQQIQREGLVSYMGGEPMQRQIERDSRTSGGRGTQFLDNFAWLEPIENLPGQEQTPVKPPRRMATAVPVPGRAGYVYSPHAPGKMVNVKRFAPGDEVRCPHTGNPFYVPKFVSPQAIADIDPLGSPRIAGERQSFKPSEAPEVAPAPRRPTVAPKPQPPKPDGLVASWVPGRANQVYSPYANKRQIVDVSGIEPGEKARCPYTDRVFVVPPAAAIAKRDEAGEEVAAITGDLKFRVLEGAEGEKPKLEAAPEKPVPAPPTAKWSNKEGFVLSPFGGELVDVTGKAAGSTVRCPFSGKLFRVPNK